MRIYDILMTIDDFLLTKKGYAGTQMYRGSWKWSPFGSQLNGFWATH